VKEQYYIKDNAKKPEKELKLKKVITPGENYACISAINWQ
jgi:hypothetical protein